jgi:anti-sigma factor RsiW
MYEGSSGERFTIYCSKVTRSDTALRFHDGKPFAAFTWVDGKIGYVVSGPGERERLERVTKLIYEQIDRDSARKS